jgi:hypothetical protein
MKKYRTLEGKKEIVKLMEGMLDKLRTNGIGIFSLSGKYDSVVSWAHYSNSHEGFCIGFDKEKLLDLINREESLDFAEVKYKEEYPIINVYRTDEHEKLTKLVWWKSIEWEYENEYRIVWYDGANKKLPIDSAISGVVILGCRIDPQNKDKIMTILKNRSDAIPLYQAKIKKDCFGLEFEKMEYKS